jgi:DNA-binding SARP family transcriptional activator
MLRGWGLKGRGLTPLVNEVDRLVDEQTVTQHFLSEDFGRLLQAQGLATLQERVDMPPQSRLDRSFSLLKRAVTYNPAQTEAWMNLAMIAFKRGDCASASRFAEHSVETNTEKADLEPAQFFATKMKEFSGDPEICRQNGAGFHPYTGL